MPFKLELIKILANLGGTVVIVCLLMYLGYKIFNRLGVPFIESQQKIAEAMGRQAQCMMEMQTTVSQYVDRDNTDHREILLSLQVVINEIKNLSRRVKRTDDEDGRRPA